MYELVVEGKAIVLIDAWHEDERIVDYREI
jgi:hypothetical protein